VPKPRRFAIVITHAGEEDRLVDMPWLETDYRIDEGDWVVLSADGWRALADGDAAMWDALERKLLIGFYICQPELVAVIGHPSGRRAPDPVTEGQAQVRRVVARIRSFLLPAAVLGFWTDEEGWLEDVVDPDEVTDARPGALATKGEPAA
jgi:hypothetical protein